MCTRLFLPIIQHVIFFIILILFLLGLYGYFYRHETNYCGKNEISNEQKNQFQFRLEMTYMYENPTYPRISMSSSIEKSYPRYGLYSYCEGSRCDAHRRKQFEGYFWMIFIRYY